MQHDEIIWQVINHQFCSFKSKLAGERTFCRNPYNVTGLCSRSSCPLANSRYATIREDEGRLHLYVKTIERAHTPKDLWEKIRLSRDYGKAMIQLNEHLEYFPKFLQHRNKQRLTKIHQYLIRMRKLELKVKPKLSGVFKKVEVREDRREIKALKAARIEKAIEGELLTRLKSGSYGDIYNFPETAYLKSLSADGVEVEMEGVEEQMEAEEEEEELIEYVEDFVESDSEEEGDIEDGLNSNDDSDDDDDEDEDSDEDSEDDGKKKKKKKKPTPKTKQPPKKRMEIEYEEEENGQTVAGEAW